MRAVVFSRTNSPADALELKDIARPRRPGKGEVVVRQSATSINPVDFKVRRDMPGFLVKLPKIPGGDVAGTVEEVGEGVSRFRPGDRVFGLTPAFGPGTNDGASYAQLCLVREDHLAKVPDGMSFEQAGSLPLAALTALQLVQKGRAESGQKARSTGLKHTAAAVGSVCVHCRCTPRESTGLDTESLDRSRHSSLGAPEASAPSQFRSSRPGG